jgi:hypothetical protein
MRREKSLIKGLPRQKHPGTSLTGQKDFTEMRWEKRLTGMAVKDLAEERHTGSRA